ncbi:MAG: NfeD family protein [Deltaproteobacteria bacterium]|nr:NfeD family protein [Deltaproteobacteria bacterium]
MNRRPFPRRALVKYALLQLPGGVLFALILIAAQRLMPLASWFIALAVAIWVGIDVLLFPWVWRSYADDQPLSLHSPVGLRGTVKTRLAPAGHVVVRGEIWEARLTTGSAPLEVGADVVVTAIDGLVLHVVSGSAPAPPQK